jgi:hypothetical protein
LDQIRNRRFFDRADHVFSSTYALRLSEPMVPIRRSDPRIRRPEPISAGRSCILRSIGPF